MLRITQPVSAGDTPTFVLEGRLAGEWVNELLRVIGAMIPDTRCTINLEEVSYVDASGEEALRALSQKGASFLAENAYGKDLCRRLHLHRLCCARPRKNLVSHSC